MSSPPELVPVPQGDGGDDEDAFPFVETVDALTAEELERDTKDLLGQSDDDDDDDFLDALDREVRHLEEEGLRADDFAAPASPRSLDEAREKVERAAEEYEQRSKSEEKTMGDGLKSEDERLKSEDELLEDAVAEEMSKPSEEEEERIRRENALSEKEREDLRTLAQQIKKAGNELYLKRESVEAVEKYTEALDTCPLCFKDDRAVFFANRAAARVTLASLEDALEDCHQALRLNPGYVKVMARRGQIYEDLDKPHEAVRDFEKVLENDPGHKEARVAMVRLPAKVAQKDEEIKQEMFDNLKKLGNMVLNPFGLSTDNFNFVKDEDTGSYKVNFNKQPS